MKQLRKVLAVMLAVLMLSTAFAMSVSAAGITDSILRFNEDGKFRIMIFADSQDDETLEETTAQLMREALDAHNPDLVVFLGDNTVAGGYENQAKAIEAIVAPCVERDIPFTLVFGNHDQEQGVEKEVLLREYQKYDGCLAYDADPSLYGCGNHNLPILASEGLDIAFNLWFIDSGTSTAETNGYDYVRDDQIEWYQSKAETLKLLNGGSYVPAISFQHIIVPEVYDAVGMMEIPFGIDEFYYNDKNFLPVPNFGAYTGFIFEPPCPSHVKSNQMAAWLETGDVMATFYGHDHVNDFTTNYEGIDITTVPTVGCNSYSNDINRGVGLITLDESDLSTYSYEALRMYDFALAEGSKIPECDGALSTIEYMFYKVIDQFLTALHDMVSIFSFIK